MIEWPVKLHRTIELLTAQKGGELLQGEVEERPFRVVQIACVLPSKLLFEVILLRGCT